ncbi:MAG TPA: universal stress protein [Thermobifida alba]|nr:universal stress protein [Thermobifida alba]
MNPTPRKNRIVVGFDGSAISLAALDWAAEEARARNCELWVVHVLDGGQATRPSYAGAPPSQTDRHSRLVRHLHQAVREAERIWPRIVPFVVGGDLVAPALLRAAAEAELLVVGTPEHRSLDTPTLSSTAAACVREARCPVVIVSHVPRTEEDERRPLALVPAARAEANV